MSITLRSAQAEDDKFLFELYAGARAEEMAAWGWSAAQQEAFLSLQFRAQQAHYDNYPNPAHQIILNDGQPVGRLFISRLADEIRLVDIALLPGHRGGGIGAMMIQGLLDEAAQSGKAVRLHVEKSNRARRLYRRLGFVEVSDAGLHILMERKPAMLDVLQIEDYARQINTTFRLQLNDLSPMEIELDSVEETFRSPRQEQFSLIFRAPHDAPRRQGVYRLEHAQLGAGELFLVPIRQDQTGLYYEAVFNRLISAGEAAAQ